MTGRQCWAWTLLLCLLVTVLLVTVARADEVKRRMRVFDLGFLRSPKTWRSGLLPASPAIRGDGSEYLLSADEVSMSFTASDSGTGSTRLAPSAVEAAIRRFIAEDSWSNSRNLLKEDGLRLISVQTPEVLEKIARFLRVLDVHHSRMISLELALVPPDVLDRILAGWGRPGASPWLEAGIFERALVAAGKRGRLLSTLCSEGIRIRLRPAVLSRHLVDYDYIGTGVVPVITPVVGAVSQGTFADARVLTAPAGRWFRVDLRIGEARIGERPEKSRVNFGDLEIVRRTVEQLSTTVAVPGGQTMLLGSFDTAAAGPAGETATSAPESFVALLRVRRVSHDERREVETHDLPALLNVGLLLEPVPDHSLPAGRPQSGILDLGDDKGPGLLHPDLLRDLVRRSLPEAEPSDDRYVLTRGTLILGASAERSRATLERLEAIARDKSRLVEIDLFQASLTEAEFEDVTATDGSLLDETWLEKVSERADTRCRLVGLSGTKLSLASVSSRTYIADVEQVSGGTGFRIVHIGDLVVRSVGQGLVLTASAELVPGTPWAQLRLRGEIARPPVFARRARLRSDLRVAPEARSGGKPVARPTADFVDIELPDEDTDRWEHMVTLPLGRAMLLSALPDRSDPGKVRVLIGAVSSFRIAARRTTKL